VIDVYFMTHEDDTNVDRLLQQTPATDNETVTGNGDWLDTWALTWELCVIMLIYV